MPKAKTNLPCNRNDKSPHNIQRTHFHDTRELNMLLKWTHFLGILCSARPVTTPFLCSARPVVTPVLCSVWPIAVLILCSTRPIMCARCPHAVRSCVPPVHHPCVDSVRQKSTSGVHGLPLCQATTANPSVVCPPTGATRPPVIVVASFVRLLEQCCPLDLCVPDLFPRTNLLLLAFFVHRCTSISKNRGLPDRLCWLGVCAMFSIGGKYSLSSPAVSRLQLFSMS